MKDVDVKHTVAEFEEILRGKGLRRTVPRMTILSILVEASAHLSASRLHHLVTAAQPTINVSPDGGDRPDGALGEAITENFGSFEAFQKQLTTATASVQGSGWGILAWEPLNRRLVVEQVYDHHGNVGLNTTPLLVFDAWEHAYYLQYRNVRPDYVEKLWSLINWNDVIARFDAAKGA
ncbi:hypothetical protein OG339_21150 [Streptosporangium sp. NBC_01495]|uniref:Fe-Mn family superoxide dismutase n=1 Tax=Streptosporangium sp. NBC_01495 TaxID=2903899 RepID=UPI002E333C18|nr:Fe-Mn family superoxide dismutase [Streptosporangium sp. NBC_01495]